MGRTVDAVLARAVLVALALLAALMLAPRDCEARDPAVLELERAGLPLVARAYRVATPEYREAIEAAYLEVDPEGDRPWWRHELYRICLRESRCGQYGTPGVHRRDSWTGRKSYARAVERGRLDPEGCPEHRLGERAHAEFSTRGGWGMNAARGLHLLGGCRGPETLDTPATAARVAALTLATCEVDRRPCTCSEHTALWVGAGRLRARPLLAWTTKSRVSTVAVQCGRGVALGYLYAELLALPGRVAERIVKL